jgi:hypothetical protein
MQSSLRPGMSVKVEILVRELENTLSVPVQAVAGALGKPTVWVWDGARATERPVTLGLTNDRFWQVLTGVDEGERILLAPPRAAPGSVRPGAASEAAAPRPAAASGPPASARPAGTPASDGGSAAERPANGGGRPRGPRERPRGDEERSPR